MLRKYPSLLLLFCIGLGIAVTDRLQLPAGALVLGALITLAAAVIVLFQHRRPVAVVLFALSVGCAAAAHFSLEYVVDSPRHLRRLVTTPQVFHIFGRVDDWPELKPGRTEVRVDVDSLVPTESSRTVCRDVSGALLIKITDTTTALQRGDRIEFVGRIYPLARDRATAGGFDYGRALHLRGIHGMVYLPTTLNVRRDRRNPVGFVPGVDYLRDAIRETFQNNLSPVSAALAGGFLIGETRDIPPEVYRMFRDSGTLHLLAVSGSNVALVLLFMAWALRPLGLRPGWRALVLLGVILLFAALSYGDPSVIRASVMAALVIAARRMGRPYDLNNIIALTAVIILLFAPAQLYDVGFQLSFITAWGLVFFVPRVARLFARYHERRWYRWGVFPVIVCFVAQVCSTPVIAYHFGRLPYLALPANLVVVPMVAVGTTALLVLLAAAFVSPWLAAWFGSLVDLLLRAVVQVLVWFGGEQLPSLRLGDTFDGDLGLTAVVVAYAFLLLLGLALCNRTARRWTVVTALLLVNVGLGTVLIQMMTTPATRVEVHPVPGGALGVITYGRNTAHDLVLTSLAEKDYALEEKVFLPLLERLGVDSVRHVFVLRADYGALDDLARLAQSVPTGQLCLETHLAASWTDLVTHNPAYENGAVRFFGDNAPPIDSLGIMAGGEVIDCLLPSGRVVFANNLPEKRDRVEAPAVLVLGGSHALSVNDCLLLREAGFTAFVCSRFAQADESWPDAEMNPDYAPPEFIHDLSRRGYWQLEYAR